MTAVAVLEPASPLPVVLLSRPIAEDLDAADARLLAGLQRGDAGTLDLLYQRYHRLALAIARRIVRDEEIAEEVVQEAFLSVWRRADSYQPERGAVRTWISGIV